MRSTILLIIFLFIPQVIHVIAQGSGQLQTDLTGMIDLVVAKDGSGDYTIVQDAVNAVPNNSSEQTVIFIKKGIYKEKIVVPETKIYLTLIGEDVDSTIITYDDFSGRIVNDVTLTTSASYTIEIHPSDFRAINLTFSNTAGDVGQAVAVKTMGDRQVFLHCKFLGWQDTYYTNKPYRNYLKDCWIEGAVDYIFGNTTVIFDSCQINTVRDGGILTAASTEAGYQYGYIFFNCRLTAPPNIEGVYLGRPWRPDAKTVFFKCYEGKNITPAGWREWDGRENTCYYAEYQCTGPGSDTTLRKSWSHQLTDEQAVNYTLENIFSKANKPDVFTSDWDPAIDADTLYTIVKNHTIMYLDSANFTANLKSLKCNGTDIPGFNRDIYDYVIEFPAGTVDIPVLTTAAESPESTIEITNPVSLPGWARINILARDKTSYNTYNIYYSVNHSYSNALLDSIRVAGSLVEDFNPEQFEYDVVLPSGTTVYLPVNGYAQVSEAKVIVTRPASFPGVATVVVTAVDDSTTRTYTINLSIATHVPLKESQDTYTFFQNPVTDNISFRISISQPGIAYLKIYDMTGKLVKEKTFHGLHPDECQLYMEGTLIEGIYLYQLNFQDELISGKLIKW